MNNSIRFPIEPGPWRQQVIFDFHVRLLIIVVRDTAGNRVESGLPEDLAIDAGGTSYPVRSNSELRRDTEDWSGYSANPDNLDQPGGQDTGVQPIHIDLPPGSKILLHATWPVTLEPGGTLEILPS